MNEKLSHKGDPCRYCGIAHDDVGIGACSGLEMRHPLAGEWFIGYKGYPKQAHFNLMAEKFPVLVKVENYFKYLRDQ